jgi:hypothetical protein
MNILKKILEEIEKEQNSYEADHAWNYSKGLEYAKEIIRSHMNHNGDTEMAGWIPCSEKLPEDGKEVLAQFVVRVRHTNRQVDEMVYIYPLHYEEGEWKSFHGMPNGKVEAWQPLPEPYKGEEAAG